MNATRVCRVLLVILVALGLGGCGEREPDVVLYTSIDEPVARPIIQDFQRQTGLKVQLVTDTEASRTAGLAERLEAEKDRPQADVWWGNEIFHTINLAERGVLAPYASPQAKAIPAMYKDPQERWAATALRARVIAVSTAANALPPITCIQDLANPALKGKICMASPRAGTTRGQVAALYTLWGTPRAEQFLRQLKENQVKLVGGNSIVAEMVGRGTMWAGLTDNDDVDAALRENGKLRLVLPDQALDQVGTLTMPCTVGLVASAPHGEAARKLVDYLLSPEVEQKLLAAKFARFSVFDHPTTSGVRAMQVDYRKVAASLKPATDSALKILEGR